MATPGTLVLKKGNEYILFKVRHDGFEIENFFKNKKMAFENTFEETIPEFLKFFYPQGFPDYAVKTLFSEGFKTTLKENFDLLILKRNKTPSIYIITILIKKIEANLKTYLKSRNIEYDGLLGDYGDGILLDFDSKLLFGLTTNSGKERVYDQDLKVKRIF